jgi:aspartate aminotransferase
MNSNNQSQFQLAKRLDGVSESATLKLNATVQMLKSKGVDVVNLTAGEPDFNVPDVAKEAVIEAIRLNRSKYTPAPGIIELREAVAKKTNSQQPRLEQPWKASDVVITNGGKQALFNSCLALINPGDEVLIPSPYWLSYPEMVKLAGGVPKMIPTSFDQDFKINPEQLKAALGPKVKMLILNSPSNPTGMMYSREEFEALGKILLDTPQAGGVWVVSDEIYDRIELDQVPFCSFLGAVPHLRDRTITVNGMSKSAAMTGWRIGWTVAPEHVTQGLITIQGQSTSGINSLAQWASLAALKLPESSFEGQVTSYRDRKNLVVELLKKAPGIDLVVPDGAFYVFFGVKKHLKTGEDSMSFAQRLLEDAKVAVVPGTPFGEPEFLRLSFATDEKTLIEGISRIVKYLS